MHRPREEEVPRCRNSCCSHDPGGGLVSPDHGDVSSPTGREQTLRWLKRIVET